MRYLLLFFVSSLFGTAFAQLTPLVNKSFKNTFTVPDGKSFISLATEEPSYPDWQFNTCYAVKNSGNVWLQIGSTSTSGSLVTPPLRGLSGNARICAQVYGRDDNTRVGVSVDGSEKKQTWQNLKKKEQWYRLSPVLLINGTESSCIKFTCEAQEGFSGYKNIFIANIQIDDMGDCIYDESFDRNEGTGGNDGSFVFPTGAAVLTTSAFDYISSSPSNVYPASGCIVFGATEGTYQTGTVPVTGHLKLLFRIAGVEGQTASMKVKFLEETRNITMFDGKWKDVQVDIPEATEDMHVTFEGTNCFLDDVRVKFASSGTVGFSETAENVSALKAVKDDVVDIELTRTLKKDIWNTLCLPFNFDVSMLRYFMLRTTEDGEVDVRRLSSVEDGVFTFAPAQYVPAGEPFLVKVNTTVENPVFRNVIIRQTTPKTISSADCRYGFAGALTKTTLPTDGSHLFLGTDGSLKRPSASGNTLNGMRAYFIVSGGNARVSFMGDEEIASICTTTAETGRSDGRLFNLMGQRVQSGRGLLIKDGKKYLSR